MLLDRLRRYFRNDLPRPPEPTAVLFAHGYLGALGRPYWIGCTRLIRDLEARGIEVRVAQSGATDRIADRARALAAELDRVRAPRVIVVAHSMGGLDARYLAAWLDPTRRISDVITLGTPHRGTYAADLAHRLGPRLPALVRAVDQGGLHDLTREAARGFDAEMPDRADVRYRAIAGRIDPASVPGPLQVLAQRLQRRQGDNDGLVPVSSARWGETVVVDDADHWSLIGLEWVAGPDLEARVNRMLDGGKRPLSVLRGMLRESLLLPRQPRPART